MYSRIGSWSRRGHPNVNYLPSAAVRTIPTVEFQSRVWTVSPSRERLPHSPVATPPAVCPLSPGVPSICAISAAVRSNQPPLECTCDHPMPIAMFCVSGKGKRRNDNAGSAGRGAGEV